MKGVVIMKTLVTCIMLDIIELFWKEAGYICSYWANRRAKEENFGLASRWLGREAKYLEKANNAHLTRMEMAQ